ncbi:neurexophilin-2-like [Cucumis melo var. makuwa]|uniref:Neurexophilin-2-like n=1 Tax=Cucumis melo var. makuwa TaxID=1194695 RepID=A0A5A7SRI7_CUCMM|nr:neurexophilin-2-like [Cucumis melo var. makuwa]
MLLYPIRVEYWDKLWSYLPSLEGIKELTFKFSDFPRQAWLEIAFLSLGKATASCSLCAIGCKELLADRPRCWMYVVVIGLDIDRGVGRGRTCALRICASFGSTRLICASFGSTRLMCASFGSTRLICAPFGSTRLIGASFGSTRLMCASFGSTRLICAFYGTTRLLCKCTARGKLTRCRKDA